MQMSEIDTGEGGHLFSFDPDAMLEPLELAELREAVIVPAASFLFHGFIDARRARGDSRRLAAGGFVDIDGEPRVQEPRVIIEAFCFPGTEPQAIINIEIQEPVLEPEVVEGIKNILSNHWEEALEESQTATEINSNTVELWDELDDENEFDYDENEEMTLPIQEAQLEAWVSACYSFNTGLEGGVKTLRHYIEDDDGDEVWSDTRDPGVTSPHDEVELSMRQLLVLDDLEDSVVQTIGAEDVERILKALAQLGVSDYILQKITECSFYARLQGLES